MRKLFGILAAGALALSAASAGAAPVAGTLTMTVAIQGLAPITLSAPGSVDISGSTITVAKGAVALATPVVVPVTGVTAVASITATKISNLTGVFAPGGAAGGEAACPSAPIGAQGCVTGGGIGGVMGLTGTVKVHVIPNVVVIPVNLNGALIGQGGSTNTPFTIDAAPFTLGQGQVGSVPTPNAAMPPTPGQITTFVTSGTGGPGGSFTLVSPTRVLALGNLLPIVAKLSFVPNVPEPGTLLLLGSGMAGLALLGRKK